MVTIPAVSFRILTLFTLTTGTTFIMWFGEQVTERGMGNGISLIIFAGIVAALPDAVAATFEFGRPISADELPSCSSTFWASCWR